MEERNLERIAKRHKISLCLIALAFGLVQMILLIIWGVERTSGGLEMEKWVKVKSVPTRGALPESLSMSFELDAFSISGNSGTNVFNERLKVVSSEV
jgi:hypothetical protein